MSKNKSSTVLVGEERLAAKLSMYNKDMTEALAQAMLKFGFEIQRASEHLVPRVTGELAARSFTEGPLTDGTEYHVVVGYEKHGAQTGLVNPETKGTFYAVPVHERLSAQHKPGKQAKFLEQPFKEKAGEYLEWMARAAEKVRT